jgi:hypothetical protein
MLETILVLVVFMALIVGVGCGWLVLDYVQRAKIKTDLTETLSSIKDVHNKLVEQMAKLQEQVNLHEFKLSGDNLRKK